MEKQREESTLLIRLNSVEENKIIKYALIFGMCWIFTPIVIIVLNISGIGHDNVGTVWLNIEGIIGTLGIALGILYIYFMRCVCGDKRTFKDILRDYLPLVILLLFLLWTFLCCLLADNKWISFMGYYYRHEGFLTYSSYAGFIILGIIISKNNAYVIQLARAFVGTIGTLSLLSIMKFPFLRFVFGRDINPDEITFYRAIYYNTNHFGYLLALALLTCFFLYLYDRQSKWYMIIYSLLSILLTNALILNDTLGSYLATIVCLFFVLIWKFINKETNKGYVTVFIFGFLTISFFSLIYTANLYNDFRSVFGDISILNKYFAGNGMMKDLDSIGTSRGKLWKFAIEKITERPVFGYGLDGLAFPYIDAGINNDRPHNIFIQTAAYTGIPGLLMYISVYVIGAIRLLKARKTISNVVKSASFIVVGYMMSAFFGNSMFYTSPYFLLIFGICCSGCIKSGKEDRRYV